MATITELLETLNEPYRSAALANHKHFKFSAVGSVPECTDLPDAIASAFRWRDTPEGGDYWSDVYNQALSLTT